MTKKIIYQEAFVVSGIMCHENCGSMIHSLLNGALEELKAEGIPKDAELSLDTEPLAYGIHRIYILVESADDYKNDAQFSKKFKDNLGFDIIDVNEPQKKDKNQWGNWLNIGINIFALISIIILWSVFPPSLFLTIGLTLFSFITTAFTAREYLINFFRNLYNKTLTAMATPITLGWFLSLAHTLYHSIQMPLSSSASMMFMSYIMPILLITVINVMDELKARIMQKTTKMHLEGLQSVFPQMADEYPCYTLAPDNESRLIQFMTDVKKKNAETLKTNIVDEENKLDHQAKATANMEVFLKQALQNSKSDWMKKSVLKENMIIQVQRGQCFPVDGFILQGITTINNAIATGKFHESKQVLDFIPAGAMNLGQDVIIYATESVYNSAINKLMLVVNRDITPPAKEKPRPLFMYLYGALIILGIAAAILVPLAFGIFTVPLLLQNLTGILFSICPCTLAIAQELPKMISMYQRYQQGVMLRNDSLIEDEDAIDIIVFDKTGTLTTGNSEVESFDESLTHDIWERIYLLEKNHGGDHPLAKAIINYYKKYDASILFKSIKKVSLDSRGLSATVQNKKMILGSPEYLLLKGIALPSDYHQSIKHKTDLGYTPICVAEDGVYCGVIFIKHELREDLVTQLQRLKYEGKTLIMLTGDSKASALGFNKQLGSVFHRIEAQQKPEDKEAYLKKLMDEHKSKKVWFIGDGLNDTRCARKVTEKHGVSCAMSASDKAAYFTDISLNGSLNYIFEHGQLNAFNKKNITQNQGLMIYSTVAFLACIITFSLTGIAVSPLIPLLIMVATTGFVLFNTYRGKLAVDVALEKQPSLLKQALVSDFSLALLIMGSTLLIAAILTATIATGGLALPVITFTAGIAMAVSSSCLLGALGLLSTFVLVFIAHLMVEKCIAPELEGVSDINETIKIKKRVNVVNNQTKEVQPAATSIPIDSVAHQDLSMYSKGLI